MWRVVAMVVLIAACGRTPAPASQVASPPPAPAAPADSLVLHTRNGVEVWFAYARADTAADGRACLERTLEIRHPDGSKIGVPLLYTGAAPVQLNDSTIRADIWVRCAPTERYRIALATGIPTAERRR